MSTFNFKIGNCLTYTYKYECLFIHSTAIVYSDKQLTSSAQCPSNLDSLNLSQNLLAKFLESRLITSISTEMQNKKH